MWSRWQWTDDVYDDNSACDCDYDEDEDDVEDNQQAKYGPSDIGAMIVMMIIKSAIIIIIISIVIMMIMMMMLRIISGLNMVQVTVERCYRSCKELTRRIIKTPQ